MIGVLATCLAYSISRVVSDTIAFRDKLAQLPDPAMLVTKNLIDDKVVTINQKIDDNNKDTKESLRRIEGKIDSLTFSLATQARREERPKQTGIFPPRVFTPDTSVASESRLSAH